MRSAGRRRPHQILWGDVEFKDGKIQTSYEEYVGKVCPMTLRKGEILNPDSPIDDQERAHSLQSNDDPCICSNGKILAWTKLSSFLPVTWRC